MKIKFTLICLLFLVGNSLKSQEPQEIIQEINELKKNVILEKLHLDNEKKTAFTTIFSDYTEKIMELRKNSRPPFIHPKDATNEQAQNIILSQFAEAKESLKIREAFYEKAIKIIAAKELLEVFHLDRKFDEELHRKLQRKLGNPQ